MNEQTTAQPERKRDRRLYWTGLTFLVIILAGFLGDAADETIWERDDAIDLVYLVQPNDSVCIGSTCNTSVALTVNGSIQTNGIRINGSAACLETGAGCPLNITGTPGTNGTSILAAYVLPNGSLQINLSNGTTYTSGDLTGPQGPAGGGGGGGSNGETLYEAAQCDATCTVYYDVVGT